MDQFEYRVAVTLPQWAHYFREHPLQTEMNFWRPGGTGTRVEPGTPWLFLLDYEIIGCANVEVAYPLPLFKAWEYFETSNGFETREEFFQAIGEIRRRKGASTDPTTVIGCVGLTNPQFFIRPIEFKKFQGDWRFRNTAKIFNLLTENGAKLWAEVEQRLKSDPLFTTIDKTMSISMEVRRSQLVRLGQGGFRSRVTQAYGARCAVSGERSLPALEAAHIKPFAIVKTHEITNGLLLRADLHKLFDAGYVSVSPDKRFHVSAALRDDYMNGRVYYEFAGVELRDAENPLERADPRYLDWHYSTIFKR